MRKILAIALILVISAVGFAKPGDSPRDPIYMLLVPSTEGATVEATGKAIAKAIYDRTGLNMEKSIRETMRVRIFDNACRLARTLPAFILRTGLSSPFWEEVEKSLSKAPEVR